MTTVTSPDQSLTSLIEGRLPELIALRHDLHRHPQLAYEETYASDRIQQWLTRERIPFKAGLAETGIVAWITPESASARDRPAVGLRADMDALPILEQTGLPYASVHEGCMHACGHDGHMTILLGAAAVLNALRAHLHQPIQLLFQPAEEQEAGARRMIDDGALDDKVGGAPVERIFGLHGWPGLPAGRIAVRPGPLMASADAFSIAVQGRGSHGAMPHLSIDPIVGAAAIITAIQTIVSRNVAATDAAVITVAQFHAGQANNIIPAQAVLSGTIRALDGAVADQLHRRLHQVAEQTARAMGCEATIKIERGYPSLINDRDCTDTILHLARRGLGDSNVVVLEQPCMVSEDFAFYAQKVPAAFFLLGLHGPDEPPYPGLHTPHFDFADDAIVTGVRIMCEVGLHQPEPLASFQ